MRKCKASICQLGQKKKKLIRVSVSAPTIPAFLTCLVMKEREDEDRARERGKKKKKSCV